MKKRKKDKKGNEIIAQNHLLSNPSERSLPGILKSSGCSGSSRAAARDCITDCSRIPSNRSRMRGEWIIFFTQCRVVVTHGADRGFRQNWNKLNPSGVPRIQTTYSINRRFYNINGFSMVEGKEKKSVIRGLI